MISQQTVEKILQFSHERDWGQFHTPASLSRSISIEAAELLECFQWQDEPRNGDWHAVEEELADILTYCVLMADSLHVDMDEIITAKLKKSAQKYPVEKAKGSSKKYNEI